MLKHSHFYLQWKMVQCGVILSLMFSIVAFILFLCTSGLLAAWSVIQPEGSSVFPISDQLCKTFMRIF